MTHTNLTAIDSETLRGLLVASQEAEQTAQYVTEMRLSAENELDAIEREAERVRRVLYDKAVPYCEKCDGPCHHGYEGACAGLVVAVNHRIDFRRYRELVLLANRRPETPAVDSAAQAFAIKRELIRRGDWP